MADDFQVKQGVNTQSSSGAYGLTGGIIGAAAGGLGAHYITKPKYSSHEDIINEAKDSADFKSKLEKATGEEKNFLQAAKDVADEKAKATEAYDAKVKALTEGTATTAELPENHQTLDNLKNAKQKLEAKKNSLIDKKVKEMGVTANKEELSKLERERQSIFAKRKSAINNINAELQKIAEQRNRLAEIYKTTERSKIKKGVLEKLQELDAKIEELASNEVFGFGENKEAKEKFVQQMKSVVQNLQSKADYEGIPVDVKNDYIKYEANLKSLEDTMSKYSGLEEKIDAKYNGIYDEIRTAAAKKDKAGIQAAIEKLPSKQQEIVNKYLNNGLISENKLNQAISDVTKVQTNQFIDRVIKTEEKNSKKQAEAYEKIYTEIQEALAKKDNKALGEAFNKLPEDQQKKLQEMLKNGWIKEDFDKALSELRKVHSDKIEAFKKTLTEERTLFEQIEKLGGEGAHFADVVENGKTVTRLVDKDGNVVRQKLKSSSTMATRVGVPANSNSRLTELDNKIAELKAPEKELREKAAAAITEADYANELKAVKDAEAAVEKAKAELPKGEKLTLEQATEMVNKELNVKNKDEYIANQTKSKAEKFAKDFESQFKRKYGFAEHANWKIAGVAAAGAIILGGLANLMAPKDRA